MSQNIKKVNTAKKLIDEYYEGFINGLLTSEEYARLSKNTLEMAFGKYAVNRVVLSQKRKVRQSAAISQLRDWERRQ